MIIISLHWSVHFESGYGILESTMTGFGHCESFEIHCCLFLDWGDEMLLFTDHLHMS